MSRFLVSTVLQHLEQLAPTGTGLSVNGANLLIANTYSNLLRSPEVEAVEIFLPPAEYERREIMGVVAGAILPEDRRGKGALRFYPIHFAEQIWSDEAPRILLSPDIRWLNRDRYLRDMFASGPMCVSCQIHGYGNHECYQVMAPVGKSYSCEFDSIVGISEACCETMRLIWDGYLGDRGAPPPCRIDVVHNPIDAQYFSPCNQDEKRSIRKRLELREDACITLYFGRLTPNSKADLLPLVRAFAKVSRPNDLLLIAGEENTVGYAEMLRAAGEASGLADRIVVRTPIPSDDRADYYRASDLFAFPCDNVQETLANTALEAMACGLPVLVSDWDGPRDIVVDGVTGYRVPTYMMPGLEAVENYSPATAFMSNMILVSQNVWVDSQIFTKRLESLLRSPELRKQMGDAGRTRALENFTWASIGARLFRVWDELLSSAKQESSESRASRRQGAKELGLPIPFRALHAPYPTASVDEDYEVRLTDRGALILDDAAKLGFYDECLPLVRPEAVQALLALFREHNAEWITLAIVAEHAQGVGSVSKDSALFHAGLLLKHDVIELRAPNR